VEPPQVVRATATNSIKLTGFASAAVNASSPVRTQAMMALRVLRQPGTNNSFDDFQVLLVDKAAAQALSYVEQGAHVSISGRLCYDPQGRLFIQAEELRMVSEAARAARTSTAGTSGRSRSAPLVADTSLQGYNEGKTLQQLAAERGGSERATPQMMQSKVLAEIIECAAAGKAVDWSRLCADAGFSGGGQGGLSVSDVVQAVEQHLQQPGVPLTKQGKPKMAPIRLAMLQNRALKTKVEQQEAQDSGATYNQLKLALAAREAGVDLLAAAQTAVV